MKRFKIFKKLHNCLALSLIELLVWILISNIIWMFLLEFYVLVDQVLSKTYNLTELSYQLHVADFIIRSKVSQAGYHGLVSVNQQPIYSMVAANRNNQVIPKAAIAVCKPKWLDCDAIIHDKFAKKLFNKKLKPNTDLLLVYDVPMEVSFLEEDSQTSLNNYLIVNKQFSKLLEPEQQLIITDLYVSERIVISKLDGAKVFHLPPENISDHLLKRFSKGSEIIQVSHIAFYVAKDHERDLYNLYMDYLTPANHYAQALLEQVEDFQVQAICLDHTNGCLTVSPLRSGWRFGKYFRIVITCKMEHQLKTIIIGVALRN